MSNDYGFAPSLRWNNEVGGLSLVTSNEIFEKETLEIELNTSASTFVVDMPRREVGKARIAIGVYKVFLAPVGQELPPLPAEEIPFTADYKPCLGVDVWSPGTGIARIEATSVYFRRALARIWQEYGLSREGAQGLLPVIRFTGSRPASPPKYPNKVYFAPVILLVGWLARNDVAVFAEKAPTVPLPVWVENDSWIAATLQAKLEAPRREEAPSKLKRGDVKTDKKIGPAKRGDLDDLLDDQLPEDL